MSDSVSVGSSQAVAGGDDGKGPASTDALEKLAEALSAQQQAALAALCKGESIKQAAEAAGVNRGTLYRWLKVDARFRAAYNFWQQEHRESCRTGLLKCAEKAVARLNEAVDFDQRLAFQVVKELGLFSKVQMPNTDPELVQLEIEVEQLEAEERLGRRQLRQLMGDAAVTRRKARQWRTTDEKAAQDKPAQNTST